MTQAPSTTEARRQVIRLLLPVSTNNLFGTRADGRGRYKTARYRKWIAQSDRMLMAQWRQIKQICGPVDVTLRIPVSARIDPDNALKAVLDLLVSRELTGDDKHHRRVTVERAALPAGECEVVVEGA